MAMFRTLESPIGSQRRVAYLVAERSVPAEACLAITFTRRAAAELSERLATLLPSGSGEPFVATFHALALAICREQYTLLGLAGPPSVADETDRAAVLTELDMSPDKAVPDELREGYRKRLRERGLLELDELVAYGQIGLLEAAERFDSKVGANFLTFAHYRIKGAIFDGLRKMGTLRGGDQRAQYLGERATSYLQSASDREHRHPPTSQPSGPVHIVSSRWGGQVVTVRSSAPLTTRKEHR